MPGPFGALSKVQKAEIAKQMDEVIVVDGREIRKGDMLEFEIEKRLRLGQGTEDIMRSLRKQGLDVAPAYVRERMAVARGRKPIEGDRGYDKRYTRMELNYIIERGLANGNDWDAITRSVQDAYPNRDVSKIIEAAKNKRAKMLQQASPPAVIDNGESGPMAPEDQPPVFDPEAEARAANRKVLENKSVEEQLIDLLNTAKEAGRKRSENLKGLREQGAEEAANDPLVQELERLVSSFATNPVRTGARVMDSVDPTNVNAAPQNLDVPVAPAGVNGPVTPEFRQQNNQQ